MTESIAVSIVNTLNDLNRSGLVDEITMRNIEQLCLPDVQEYSPAQIVSLRKKFKLSQAALASIFNISLSKVIVNYELSINLKTNAVKFSMLFENDNVFLNNADNLCLNVKLSLSI